MATPVNGNQSALGDSQAYRLTNTTYSEVASCLPLPVLPIFFGAADPEIQLFNEARALDLNRPEILAHAAKVAALLNATDVSYLSRRGNLGSCVSVQPGTLLSEVLHYDPGAFNYSIPGSNKETNLHKPLLEKKLLDQNVQAVVKEESVSHDTPHDHADWKYTNKNKLKRKSHEAKPSSAEPNLADVCDSFVRSFCQILDDICGKVENSVEDPDETESLPLPLSDIKILVIEIMAMRARNLLYLVPIDVLSRVLNVLDGQILYGHGLSLDEIEASESDTISLVLGALEASHASLAILAHKDMPKQLYKEEIIDRIIEFSRHQMMDCMLAADPSFRALHKPRNDDIVQDDEDENDADINSGGKRNRRNTRSAKLKKITNRVTGSVGAVMQKLCTILGFLKDLMSIERLADSSILQLVKTSFTTFLVDNVQLLQLKAISLISAVCSAYSQHRTFLIDETLQVLWKLPFSKRSLRAYHISDDEQIQIQMITALLIQLVQCSASTPVIFRETLAGDDNADASTEANQPNKCYGAVIDICCHFWSSILHRWTHAKTQDGSDLKGTMENLVMDLLTTYNLPEYPASAIILEVLCVLLLQNTVLQSKDVSTRCVAVDLLGMIAARLKHDSAIFREDKFWFLQELNDGHKSDAPKEPCSVCLDGSSVNEVVTCHGCRRCFHGECVGVIGKDAMARSWFCSFCLCKNQLTYLYSYWRSKCNIEEIKNHPQAANVQEVTPMISGVEVVRQMLLNCLQGSQSSDDFHLVIRWFYLCLWQKGETNQGTWLYHPIRLKSKEIWDIGTSASMFSKDLAKRVSFALARNRSFARGFDKVFNVLLKNLQEKSPVLRAKALRAVSVIVEADPEVLCEERVQYAVEERFSDSAISVREAALELISRYISSHPDVGTKYFEKIAERIKDTGVSVRKRAIKIIRDMCVSNSHFDENTSACLQIISRISDEESSVQDLVCKTFYELWFEEPSNVPAQYTGDNSCVPLETAKKTEQIVGMLRKMSNHQPLTTLVRRTLALDFLPQSSRATGINAVSLASVRKRAELMCKCLLERILQIEENNVEEREVPVLPYVLALHAFCVVDPTICAPPSDPSQFLVTLMPYLKSQVNDRKVAHMLQSILAIIDAVLPLLRRPSSSFIEELEQDLRHMILQHSFLTVVRACIKCLCTLSRISNRGAIAIRPLIWGFFKHLDVSKGLTGTDNEKFQRSLFCLGQLIRYGIKSGVSLDHQHSSVVKILALLKHYLISEDFGVKVRSLQALGHILVALPEYMLEKDIEKILEAALSPSSDTRLKIQLLQNLHEYLLDIEGELVAGRASQDKKNSGYEVPVVTNSTDSNICGGVIQLHWNNILDSCLNTDHNVRQSALKIIEVVLRQGLVHPITSVPYLIALETDQHEANSNLAHHLLVNMNEKYPAFFENRLGDGLQMSFNFIQSRVGALEAYDGSKTYGSTKGKNYRNVISYAKQGISRIYHLIRANRVSRNKFISSVVRKFDCGTWNNSTTPFLVYCTEVLSSLPFTLPDEPLYLVHTINRVIQVRAGPLESSMKTLSSYCSNGTSAETATSQGIPDQLKADHPSSNHDLSRVNPVETAAIAGRLDAPEEDQNNFKAISQASIALQLLMKLKRHLKTIYSLNDSRCQAYDPTGPLTPGEVLSRQSIPFDLQDISSSLATTPQEMLIKYQEFKAALKEDALDYSTYSANVSKKRSRVSVGDFGNTHSTRKTPSRSASSSKAVRYVDDDNDNDPDKGDDEDWANAYYRAGGRSVRGRR